MENNIEIVFNDGILTDEHLSALKIGETIDITDAKEVRFKNAYFGEAPTEDERRTARHRACNQDLQSL